MADDVLVNKAASIERACAKEEYQAAADDFTTNYNATRRCYFEHSTCL